MDIIPAIDIIDGKCVRLTQGDYNKKRVYNEDPLAVAREFERSGLKRLHLVDLDGARSGGIVNRRVLEKITAGTELAIDFGGGIKGEPDIKMAFESGAAMVTVGSVAAENPDLFFDWLNRWGPDRIILGADSRNGYPAVNGWQEVADVSLLPFILDCLKSGVRKIICTDIAKDGMMGGSSLVLYSELIRAASEAGFPGMELTASGGVASMEELDCLAGAGLSGVIIGKALYEGSITLKDLRKWAEEQGRCWQRG